MLESSEDFVFPIIVLFASRSVAAFLDTSQVFQLPAAIANGGSLLVPRQQSYPKQPSNKTARLTLFIAETAHYHDGRGK